MHASFLECGLPSYPALQGWDLAAGWGVSVHNTGKACLWESKKEGELPWIHTMTVIKSSTWFSYFRGSKRARCDIAYVFKSTELTLPACEELLLHSQPGNTKAAANKRLSCAKVTEQPGFSALSMDSQGIYSCPWLLGNLIVQVCTRGSQWPFRLHLVTFNIPSEC